MKDVPLFDLDENHVGTCGATVVAPIYRAVRRAGGADTVLDHRERHQCARPAGECTRSDGTVMHVCTHGRAWKDAKSEPREGA